MARPLSKTYDPANPFVVERHDQEDGSIVYEICDRRPASYRRLCICAEDYCGEDVDPDTDRGRAKTDADMIVTALNMVFGKRAFRSAKLRTIRPVINTHEGKEKDNEKSTKQRGVCRLGGETNRRV